MPGHELVVLLKPSDEYLSINNTSLLFLIMFEIFYYKKEKNKNKKNSWDTKITAFLDKFISHPLLYKTITGALFGIAEGPLTPLPSPNQ